MVYLEYLRARRIFVWYAGIIVVIAAFMIGGALLGDNVNFDASDSGSGGATTVHVHGLQSLGRIAVPVEALAGIAGVFAIAFATGLGANLNRNTQNAHFLFVRPVSRYKMAAVSIGTDVAAIVAAGLFAYAFAFLIAFGVLREHANFVWGSDVATITILGFGAAVMWYAVLQALSAWTPHRSGIFTGIGIGTMVTAIPLSHATFIGPLRYLFQAILFVDPLAYFTSVTFAGTGGASIGAQVLASYGARALAVWAIAALMLAIATTTWKRVEI